MMTLDAPKMKATFEGKCGTLNQRTRSERGFTDNFGGIPSKFRGVSSSWALVGISGPPVELFRIGINLRSGHAPMPSMPPLDLQIRRPPYLRAIAMACSAAAGLVSLIHYGKQPINLHCTASHAGHPAARRV